MATTRFLTRSHLISTTRQSFSSIFSRTFTTSLNNPFQSSFSTSPLSLLRLRPLVSIATTKFSHISPVAAGLRGFATRQTSSSLSDPNPNFSNRPPKETILLDGCDFEHWLVVLEKPEGDPTRDDIIDSYIQTLAQVVGSEQEARMKIYSVSTRHYYAFGALVSEELSYKLKELPRVRWVLPDSYLDVKNKDYGGEPFINGQAVPYDPKYHEEWVRNNARANERNRRNDRPRNFDRSRNFERRRDGQNMSGGPPGGNYNAGGGPNAGPMPPPNNMGGQPNMRGVPPNNMAGPPPQMGGMPPNNMGGPQNMGGMHGNMARPPQPGYTGGMPPNMGGMPNNPPNYPQGNPPSSGGMPYQSGPGPNQYNAYSPPPPNMGPPGGNPYQNQNMPGRDIHPAPPPNMGPPVGNPYQNQNMPGREMHPTPPSNMGPPSGNPYQNQNMPGRDQNYQ